MKKLYIGWLVGCLVIILLGQVQQVAGQINPTPIVITLPSGSQTPTPETDATSTAIPTIESTATETADSHEPNNTPDTATPVTFWQTLTNLILVENDVDYFKVYLKAGQIGQFSTTVYNGLDTRATAYWGDGVIAEADDRSGTDPGTTLTFSAVLEGWYVVKIERATPAGGNYDLVITAVDPTSTPTLLPTSTLFPTTTPFPTLTPAVPADPAEPNNSPQTAYGITPGSTGSYSLGSGDVDYFTFIAKAGNRYSCETLTNQVDTLLTVSTTAGPLVSSDDRSPSRVDSFVQWQASSETVVTLEVAGRGGSTGLYQLLCQIAPASPPAPVAHLATATPVMTVTATLTETAVSSPTLPIRYLGQLPPTPPTITAVRLIIYYDANNDRLPSPGEGVPNVSVLAVDVNGQRLARVFTNEQGEASFHITAATIDRLVVPFVSGWSAKVNTAQNSGQVELSLGLPAVRLPIFLPLVGTESVE